MGHIDRAISKHADLIAPIGYGVIRRDAQLILDAACKKPWKGTKPPGCYRDKPPASKEVAQRDKKNRKAPRVATLPPKSVVALDKRFSSRALDAALDAIVSDGAAERVAALRDISVKQGLQTVFAIGGANEVDKLLKKIENKGQPYRDAVADYQEAKQLGDEIEQIHAVNVKLHENDLVGVDSSGIGYTKADVRHVVVQPKSVGASDMRIDKASLSQAVDDVFSAFEGGQRQSTSTTKMKGANAVLTTYLHETGHQILWAAQNSGSKTKAPPLNSGITAYSAINEDEQFAEHFALWVLDANRLKSAHPKMHSYIEKTVKAAQKAGRRIP